MKSRCFSFSQKCITFLSNCARKIFFKLHVVVVMYLYNVVSLLRAARKIYVRDTTIKLPSRSTDELGLPDQIVHSQ